MYAKSRFAMVIVMGLLVTVFGLHRTLAQDTPQTIEMIGLIESVGDSNLTVNQLIVDVSHAEMTATLEIGQPVKVEGELLDDGTILASEVNAADTDRLPGKLELVGTLDEINRGYMIISSIKFDTATAEVQANLVHGEWIETRASLAEDGTWIAQEVQHYEPDNSSSDNSPDDSAHDAANDSHQQIGDDHWDDEHNDYNDDCFADDHGDGHDDYDDDHEDIGDDD